MDNVKFGISKVCSAFDVRSVGTKVLDWDAFLDKLEEQVRAHEADVKTPDKVPGQYFLPLAGGIGLVSAGVGPRSAAPEAYVVRVHRGRCEAFLKREHAAPVAGVAVVVYTMQAYRNDPEVDLVELGELTEVGSTHVVVAVLAFAGPAPALAPYRLVSNLAGGNREAETWTLEDARAKARDAKAYDDAWCVVAD